MGCGNSYGHKTGLNNHRRHCNLWHSVDRVSKHREKKRRLEMDLDIDLQTPPDTLGPAQNDNNHDSQRIDDAGSTTRAPSPMPAVAPPQTSTSTRSGRSVRFPRRFNDYLPVMRTALAHIPSKERQDQPQAQSNPHSESSGVFIPDTDVISDNSPSQATSPAAQADDESLTTHADRFGVYRVYPRKPLAENPQSSSNHQPGTLATPPGPDSPDTQSTPYYHPFSNPLAAAMMLAHHSGGSSTLSAQRTNETARILASMSAEATLSDLANFNTRVENGKLDAYITSASFQDEDGWQESLVRIRLPLDKKKMLESEAPEFEIGGVFHRDIIDVISSVYKSDVVQSFNHVPFKEYWKPSEDAQPERLYGEVFSSQAMLDADDEIYKFCLENDLDSQGLEAIVVPLLLYSDSTHLSSFGTASAWPVYLFIGSQSKYIRAMPTSSASHHIAYMPKVRHG